MSRAVKDRRSDVVGSSVADYEEQRALNLQKGFWACVCGSRTFNLIQQTENVKAQCTKCNDLQILYWNGTQDNSAGSMRRLDTNKWVSPKAKLVME